MQLRVHTMVLLASYRLTMNLKKWNKYVKNWYSIDWYSIDSRANSIQFKLSISIYRNSKEHPNLSHSVELLKQLSCI